MSAASLPMQVVPPRSLDDVLRPFALQALEFAWKVAGEGHGTVRGPRPIDVYLSPVFMGAQHEDITSGRRFATQ